jgi:glyoxylase-like metal-dependent hydrolase (beta-lactamase superfamily II)
MITRLNDVVSIIDTLALGQPRVVSAYLVRGKESALVDMGFESSASILIRDLAEAGVNEDELDYLLPTHVHLDHAGSCGTLAKRFSNAAILVHPKGERHLVDPTKLCKSVTELFGVDQMHKMGMPTSVDPKQVRPIGDNETIDLGNRVILRSTWTPGHASHHLSYFEEGSECVLTGDAIGTNYPDFPVLIPTTPPTSFSLTLALDSIQRIRETAPKQFLAPHFGAMVHCNKILDSNAKALREWKARIEAGIKDGHSAESLAKELQTLISGRSGLPVESMPDYVVGSISRSVLGFMQYLTTSGVNQN